MPKFEIDELRWVRLFDAIHVPKYLVEQVRDRDYSVEDFYRYQSLNILIETKNGPTLNPLHHLYVLVNPDNQIVGYLWFTISPLSKDLLINTYSVDKEYWCKGKAVKRLADHVKEIVKKLKIPKVYWLTNYPKHSERHGFKRSKTILMEYSEVEDGKDIVGRDLAQKKHINADSRTTRTLQPES